MLMHSPRPRKAGGEGKNNATPSAYEAATPAINCVQLHKK